MKLLKTEITRSESNKNNIILSAIVSYQTFAAEDKIWFEVSEEFADELSSSGNPWLVFMLPLAANLNEPINLTLPVDATLLDNARTLLHIWQSWWPDWHIPAIEADILDKGPDPARKGRIGAAFSGGVDSFFTILSHESESRSRIDDLLAVWGFDVPLTKPKEFAKMRTGLAAAAEEMDKELIIVKTNLRETQFGRLSWEKTFGAALATAALVLEKRFRVFYINSGGAFSIRPWGSSPITDHFFSTSDLQFIHDGATTTRAQKTQFIADNQVVQRTLRVCWIKQAYGNCSECIKCYRTMATLAAMGKLQRFATFDDRKFTPGRLARMIFSSEWDEGYFLDIKDIALEYGFEDVADSILQSIRYTKRRKKILSFLDTMSTLPFCWRIATTLKKRYARDFIS